MSALLRSIDDVVWDPAAQAVIAVCRDDNGAVIVVERAFRAVTPGATSALALALTQTTTPATAVVGRVQVRGDAISSTSSRCSPTGLSCSTSRP